MRNAKVSRPDFQLYGIVQKPGEPRDKYVVRATLERDCRIVRDLRFNKLMKAQDIQRRLPHRSVRWVVAVYMGWINPGV